ncbi:DUF2254 family protein [Streptomyces sp. NPDC001594]|uniref:DUF2254 family protein n=1 Tax=Streptomyces sp. NPDC001594 TaxID=3364590 RepID=UPI0036CEDF76
MPQAPPRPGPTGRTRRSSPAWRPTPSCWSGPDRLGYWLGSLPGISLLAVHSDRGALPTAVGAVTWVGSERSALQDRGFALRQLADIALRALSPAENDPTTAVQCLDRIVHLLAILATQRLGPVPHHDRAGRVRLLQAAPGWSEVVDIGIAELRSAAAGQAQVTRRLLAGINDLLTRWRFTVDNTKVS